jgi:PAS domain S-box-containing protein
MLAMLPRGWKIEAARLPPVRAARYLQRVNSRLRRTLTNPDPAPVVTPDPTPSPHQEALSNQARLFDTPAQAVIATTASGAIAYWNRTAASVYGWRADEVLGRDIVEVTPAAPVRDNAADIMRQLRAGRSWSGDFRVRRRDGSELIVYVQDFPVRDADGELIGIIGVSRPRE